MMNFSAEIDKIATALAKAQGELKPAKEDSKNEAFKGAKYADLSQCWDACREILSKNGLSISQCIGGVHEVNGCTFQEVTTALLHTSGQWIKGTGEMMIGKATPHGQGSAITYAKRYGLCAIIALVTSDEVDDDGNLASGVTDEAKPANVANYEPKPKTMADKKDDKKWVGKKGGKCYLHRNGENVNIETLAPAELRELLSEDWAKPIHKEVQNLLDSSVFDDMSGIEAAMDKMAADERK